MNWLAALGVAVGVALGLIIFACLFVAAVWLHDWFGQRRDRERQARQERERQTDAQQGTELEDVRRQLRSTRQTAQRQQRDITNLRTQLRQLNKGEDEKTTLPKIPRPRSSWERLHDS